MKEYQIPVALNTSSENIYDADKELSLKVCKWLDKRVECLRETGSKSFYKEEIDFAHKSEEIADKITKILAHRKFNYQSKNKLTSIITDVRQNLVRQIEKGKTIKFYLLYNGGYRASPILDQQSLIFEPDQTELMLLYQISLLKDKILAVYSPGIEFFIVVNNGVAKWVNDISILETKYYANQLTKMIHFFGTETSIKVLLQSELDGFDPDFSFSPFEPQQSVSDNDHYIVERFLGRSCSRDEVKHRLALYKLAESKWAKDLLPIISADDGIVMRQVAHPDMLSFRPFPGGASRMQNGTFGFQFHNNALTPKLITSISSKEHYIKWIPYHL